MNPQEQIQAMARAEQAPGNDIPVHIIRQWNWGAFLLAGLWPFWNGAPWLAVACLACSLLSVLVLPAWVGFGLSIYLGIKGNEIAARRRSYASTEEFIAHQQAWTKAAFIVLAVLGALFVLDLIVTIVATVMHNASLHH